VKNTGDGALVEFASVVDAMRCAAEIQRGMIERDADGPEEQRIRFRIGLNLGDLIVEENDIFGDGVNIAARLEALAEPGGICLSGTVHDQLHNKLHYPFDDMGEQNLKNIARPVRAYALRPEAVADLPASIAPPSASISLPAVAPRLSIVVLPFTNLSNDPEQQYFTDGLTEDLTTDLSRIAGSFVISRNTAFTYRNKPIDTKQIGRELCVRYVLEGSVRRSGSQVRVSAQLIDAETNAHVWAGRFDRDTSELFALQDEITSRIAVALNVELIAAEAARPTEYPEALDYIFRGRAAGWKPHSRHKYAEQISLFERALGGRSAVRRGAELLGECAYVPRDEWNGRFGRCRHRACRRARPGGLSGVAPQPAGAFRERPGAARAAPIRGGHPRIRDGDRVKSQRCGRITSSRPVQALRRVDRGDDHA
jgi:TolB-like protein